MRSNGSLVRPVHRSGQPGLGRGDRQRREAGTAEEIVEAVDQRRHLLPFAEPVFGCDLPGADGADQDDVGRVGDRRAGGGGQAPVIGPPPDQRVGIEQQPHARGVYLFGRFAGHRCPDGPPAGEPSRGDHSREDHSHRAASSASSGANNASGTARPRSSPGWRGAVPSSAHQPRDRLAGTRDQDVLARRRHGPPGGKAGSWRRRCSRCRS